MANARLSEEFAARATLIHRDRYDYTKVVYIRSKEKVEVVCREHGSFWVAPCHHLSSRTGCRTCYNRSIRSKIGHNVDRFATAARRIHGSRYDYNKVIYISARKKVELVCSDHGSFWTTLNNHLVRRSGCPSCANIGKIKRLIERGCKPSHGELAVMRVLDEAGVVYEREHPIAELLGPAGWPLRFDFYVPQQRLCIEFDGIQHFVPQSWAGGVRKFQETQNSDRRKEQYCHQADLILVRIKYDQKDLIREILEPYLKR